MKIVKKYSYEIFLCLLSAAALVILSIFTKQYFWKGEPYCSYILQAQSWLEGRLDLGRDYPYLELAIYGGKYFVSFPPFPSYVMLPFVALGWNSCDSAIAFAFSIAGVLYAYKIMRHFGTDKKISVFFALFLTFGSNWLMTAQNAWVWFIAQNMSFTLSLMAIYYALKNKAGLSLAFWACAVGCRPFQAIYIPVLLYLICRAHKEQNPSDKLIDIIKKRWSAAVPCFLIALSYMILNYARFDSIVEFGHNYLPEHTRSELGQFHYSYIPGNLKNLIRLPAIRNGKIEVPNANGMCIFLVSPIFVSYIVYMILAIVKKQRKDNILFVILPVLVLIHLILLCAHVQLGGWHFGNRYPSDTLPFVFLGIAALYRKGKPVIFNYPLFVLGFLFNVWGTMMYFIK